MRTHSRATSTPGPLGLTDAPTSDRKRGRGEDDGPPLPPLGKEDEFNHMAQQRVRTKKLLAELLRGADKLTVPMSPDLHTAKRARLAAGLDDKDGMGTEKLWRGVKLHEGVPTNFVPPLRPPTAFKPFALTAYCPRVPSLVARREALRQACVIEEERMARCFVARPIPDHTVVLPARQVRALTAPTPFRLVTAERAEQRQFAVKMPVEGLHMTHGFKLFPSYVASYIKCLDYKD